MRERIRTETKERKKIFFLEIRRLVLSIWASNFACFDWILVLRSCLFNGVILIIRFIKLTDWDSVLMNYNASTFSDYWLLFLFIWIVLILIWVFFFCFPKLNLYASNRQWDSVLFFFSGFFQKFEFWWSVGIGQML